MTQKNAVLYLRSSKDRSDVAIDVQREKLTELAESRGWRILGEYADVVESAKSADRPEFLRLWRDVRAPARDWSMILTANTSRIARRQDVAFAFRHDLKRAGVDLVFGEMPDLDPITRIVIESVYTAMDELHSLRSRDLGLAGMRENVRKGFRAGGRPPKGYRLEYHETGAVRDGQPVRKSKLVPTAELPAVGEFLKMRVRGVPRSEAASRAGMAGSKTTLISLEWNALTYAGHTVFNRHTPKTERPRKYRPREEWVVERDTHPAIISDADAEALLAERFAATYSKGARAGRLAQSDYLLSSVLVDPDGRSWVGDGKYYRLRHPGRQDRRVNRVELDEAVLEQLAGSMTSEDFLEALAAEARKAASPAEELKQLRREIVRINGRIKKAMDLALELEDSAPALRTVDDLERQRKETASRMADLEAQAEDRAALAKITADDVRRLFENLPDPAMILEAAVEKIELDPKTLDCRVFYRVEAPANGLGMASPRGRHPSPILAAAALQIPPAVAVPTRRRRAN